MACATATPAIAGEIAVLCEQMKLIHKMLRKNTEGLTQEDSLIQPQPGGNCLNWNVGHLDWVNEQMLGLIGQPPVLGEPALQRYVRGSKPLTDAAEALPLETLLHAWDEGCARLDAGLSALSAEQLAAPAPYSPRKKPEETIRSLLSIILFHQAAHTGQIALLRRMAGKEGAVR